VNPWDTREVADAIYEALTMSEEDKTSRWRELNAYVETHSGKIPVSLLLIILAF
jgi:trehalose 6-phosphate synthase complex regulatory subunit